MKQFIEQKMKEETTQTKSWVKELISNAVNTAQNDQKIWFNQKLGEVKNKFNVAGVVGPAEKNPYPDHETFVASIHAHKLACE